MSCDVQGEVGREGGPGDTEGETQKTKESPACCRGKRKSKKGKENHRAIWG